MLSGVAGGIVAIVGAAPPASVMRTTPGRTVASVGFALLAAFVAANPLDYRS